MTSAQECGNTHDQARNGNHFDRRKYEFGLSVNASSKPEAQDISPASVLGWPWKYSHVDDHDDDEAHSDPYSVADFLVLPVVNEDSGGRQLGG